MFFNALCVMFYIILGYLSYNDYKKGEFCSLGNKPKWLKVLYVLSLVLVYIALGAMLFALMYLMNT